MKTIYVFDNEKLGDNGDNFSEALIAEHSADTDAECLAWLDEQYGSNDYTASFTAPAN